MIHWQSCKAAFTQSLSRAQTVFGLVSYSQVDEITAGSLTLPVKSLGRQQ
jgi:hypothetical protein